MDLSKYLVSSQLLDCSGRVTHTLTLLPDGNVEVEMGATTAVVDPRARSVVRPVGVHVPGDVFDKAAVLARGALG